MSQEQPQATEFKTHELSFDLTRSSGGIALPGDGEQMIFKMCESLVKEIPKNAKSVRVLVLYAIDQVD